MFFYYYYLLFTFGYTAHRQIPSPKNKAKDCWPSTEFLQRFCRTHSASTTVLRQIYGESDAALRHSLFFAPQRRFDKFKGESDAALRHSFFFASQRRFDKLKGESDAALRHSFFAPQRRFDKNKVQSAILICDITGIKSSRSL